MAGAVEVYLASGSVSRERMFVQVMRVVWVATDHLFLGVEANLRNFM